MRNGSIEIYFKKSFVKPFRFKKQFYSSIQYMLLLDIYTDVLP